MDDRSRVPGNGIARTAYVCQIQGCNAILIFCGLAAAGLAGSQFSKVGLDNYRDIDLRLLNWLHALAGLVGLLSVARNHGSVVTKTLYAVSIVIGIATAIFYGFTTNRQVEVYRNLRALERAPGFQSDFAESTSDAKGKIAISAVMIGISALAALVACVASLLLDKLAASTTAYPIYGGTTVGRQKSQLSSAAAAAAGGTLFSALAGLKLVLGLGTLGVAVFLEYEHERVSVPDRFIKIALEHIASLFVICGAVVDLCAARFVRLTALNLKVSLALSIIAAVWCIKSVDNGMTPFYKDDLKFFYIARAQNDPSAAGVSAPRYIIVVVHGVLLGAYGLLFWLCLASAVTVAARLGRSTALAVYQPINASVVCQQRLIAFLHVLWSICLLGLGILGLLHLKWRGEFLGGDLVWLAALFSATGLVRSSNKDVENVARFVLAVTSLGVAAEKTGAAINLVYQFSTYPLFTNGNGNTFAGQIVLESCTCGVLAAETMTALAGALIYGREISKQQPRVYGQTTFLNAFLALGVLFYGVVMTGCYIVFEFGKWRYAEVPIDVPFFRLPNGPFAVGVFIVQAFCLCRPSLLAAATVLQLVVAALSSFALSSAITNVYYLQTLLAADDVLKTTPQQETVLTVAVILAAGAALSCVLCTFFAVLCLLHASYLLHHKSTAIQAAPGSGIHAPGSEASSTIVGALEPGSDGSQPAYSPSSAMPIFPSPGTQWSGGRAAALQEREEQSVYWSADDNPFYYHTSRRFYGQPYQVDAAYWPYSPVSPPPPPQQHQNVLQRQRMRSPTNDTAVQTTLVYT